MRKGASRYRERRLNSVTQNLQITQSIDLTLLAMNVM